MTSFVLDFHQALFFLGCWSGSITSTAFDEAFVAQGRMTGGPSRKFGGLWQDEKKYRVATDGCQDTSVNSDKRRWLMHSPLAQSKWRQLQQTARNLLPIEGDCSC